MTNVILLVFAVLMSAMFFILAALVDRWDKDHNKLKELQRDLDHAYDLINDVRYGLESKFIDISQKNKELMENDEAAANAILNIRNDISKLSIRVNKLEGRKQDE